MIIECPQCRRSVQVDDTLAGQQVKCPFCQTTMTAPGSILPPTPSAKSSASTIFRVLMVCGAGILVVSFFLPWWSATIDVGAVQDVKGPDELTEMALDLGEVAANKITWYIENVPIHKVTKPLFEEFEPVIRRQMGPGGGGYGSRRSSRSYRRPEDVLKELELSVTLFGWDTTTGILCLCFGGAAIGFLLLSFVRDAFGPWTWLGEFALSALMLPLVALSLIWWIGSPGKNVDPVLSQGVSVGPFLALVGSAVAMVAGAINSMAGSKAARSARAA